MCILSIYWGMGIQKSQIRGKRNFTVVRVSAECERMSALLAHMRRSAAKNTIYCFETWGQQILDFVDAFIGEPVFVITNSVGGAH